MESKIPVIVRPLAEEQVAAREEQETASKMMFFSIRNGKEFQIQYKQKKAAFGRFFSLDQITWIHSTAT